MREKAKHSSGSLKQGVWGAVPPRSCRVFHVSSSQMMQMAIKANLVHLEYIEFLSKAYQRGIDICTRGVVGAAHYKVEVVLYYSLQIFL